MILSKEVIVVLNNHTKKFYQNLGYKIPLEKIKGYKKPRMKNGTSILVKVEDLYKGSKVKVLCKCDKCGKERFLEFSQYRNLCHYCACTLAKGNKSATWDFTISEQERKVSRKRYFWEGYNTWKRLVKQKFNYTCQKCNHQGSKRDGTIVAHHLNNFSDFKELRSNVDNGICLCKKCHHQFHSLFGYKHTTKLMMDDFFTNPLILPSHDI